MYSERTTGDELKKIAKDIHVVLDQVVMTDELKSVKPKVNSGIIINLADSDQVGTHWVCLYIDKKMKFYYFDSFGMPPPTEVTDYVKKHSRYPLTINKRQFQNISEGYCGQYCLMFLHVMQHGKSTSENNFQKLKKIVI